MKSPWTGLLLFMLMFGANGSAQSNWTEVRTRHLTIMGNASAVQMANAGASLEDFLRAIQKERPETQQQPVAAIRVILFNDDASYAPFKPLYKGGPTEASGYFLAGSDISFITAVVDPETQRVLYHELFHALSRQSSRPLWANEGLADYYSTFDGTFHGGIIASNVAELRSNPWIPLRRLLTATTGSPDYQTPKNGMFDAESWALVHYLLTNGKPVDDSVRKDFEANPEELERALSIYVAAFPLTGKLPKPRTTEVRDGVDTRAISESEAATWLANLSLHLDRFDDAEARLKQAFHSTPTFPGANTVMGMLKMRQGRNSEALPFLRTAALEDADNPLAHFYYAEVLQALASDQKTGERELNLRISRIELNRTLELAPWFADAAQWLGYVTTALQMGYDEAELRLKEAIERYPERADLTQSLTDLRRANQAQFEAERAKREREYRALQAINRNAFAMASPPMPVQVEEQRATVPAPKPRVNYPTLRGFLTMIDCTRGITLVVRSGDHIVRFNTPTPSHLEFTGRNSKAANEAACGALQTPYNVVVTYKQGANASFMGEPLRVEYP